MSSPIKFSIISPVYRGEKTIQSLVEKLMKLLPSITPNFEIILVEDSSPDNSWDEIDKIASKNKYVKGVKLSRNFGQQYALQAGLDLCSGDYVVTMDCDLQDNPTEILKLYDHMVNGGYDIVYAQRLNRRDNFVKKTLSKIFYKVLSYLSETTQDPSIANFVIYRKKVVAAMSMLDDYRRYYPMMSQWVGFKADKVEITHMERTDGLESSYDFKKRLDLAVNTIISFSDKPLRLTIKFGLFIVLISVIIGITVIIMFLSNKIIVPGWTSLAIIMAIFSGSIILVCGIVGIYVAHAFEKTKGRPSYIIDEKLNL